MLLIEAIDQLQNMLIVNAEKEVPAVEMAIKALEAQITLADILNDMQTLNEKDSFSVPLVIETLYQVWSGDLPEEYKYLREDSDNG